MPDWNVPPITWSCVSSRIYLTVSWSSMLSAELRLELGSASMARIGVIARSRRYFTAGAAKVVLPGLSALSSR